MTLHAILEGTLRLYEPSDGGFDVPAGWVSGLLRVDDLGKQNSLFGCRISFPDGRERLPAGQEAAVSFLTIAEFEYVAKALRPGMEFRFWHGRDIGEGVITDIGQTELVARSDR